MAENIDELQIEIESDASSALTGLENLAKSLEKLKKATNGIESSASGLKALVSPLRSISKLDNLNLTANIGQLELLTSTIKGMKKSDFKTFSENIDTLSAGITKLGGFKVGNIGTVASRVSSFVAAFEGLNNLNLDFGPRLSSISSAISTLSSTSDSLNGVDFEQFETNIGNLKGALKPLEGFQTQASGLLTAMRGIPQTAKTLNDFEGFDDFKKKVGELGESMQKLNGINTKFGAALDDLGKVKQAADNIAGVDLGGFKTQVGELGEALALLPNTKSKLGSTLDDLSRVGTVAQNLASSLKSTNLKKDIKDLAKALSGLNAIEKGNIGSVMTSLEKIPKITAALDTASLDAFASAIQRLTAIMAPLAAELRDVHNGFSLLPMAIREAIRLTEQSTATNSRAVKSYGKLFNSLTRTITKFTVLFYALRRFGGIFADALNTSNDYIETMNLFSVAMGEYADEAKSYAKTIQDALGIDMAEWMNNQAVFMQTLSGFGVAADEASHMSRVLTQLGYDFASLWNADVELVMQRLESAMTGQIKGMKNYGVNVSVAALQETALALGIDQSVRSMSEAQRAQLRYITILRSSEGVLGDLAKTINSPANALRVLNTQFTRMKRAFGDIVSVIATRFIPYMQALVEIVTEAAEALAVSMGFEIEELPSNVLNGTGTMKEDLEEGSDYAKELKKQLMGFDELNILKTPDQENELSDSLGIDMFQFDYDFLAKFNEEYAKTVEDAKLKILEVVGAVKEVAKWAAIAGGVFLGWKIATGFATGVNAIGTMLGLGGKKASGGSKIPKVTTVLKGLAELAIVVGGVVLLVEALGLLMKIPGFEETARDGIDLLGIVFKGLFEIAVPIGLAAVACNLLGKAGVGNIAKGFAGFAIVAGGTAALVTAIGALLSIPGFDNFLSTGIASLKDVFNGLYDIAIPIGLTSALITALGFVSPGVILSGFGGFAIIIGGTTALVTAIGALLSIPGFDEFLSTGISSLKDTFNGLYDIAVPIGLTTALITALGFVSPGPILSGLAGFALILGGTAALVTAIGAIISIPGFDEFLSTGINSVKDAFNGLYDVAVPIGVLSGLITALGFASPGVVLSGLAGFASIVGGMELLLAALGGLKQIPGFTWIIDEGKAAFVQIGDAIGSFGGSIVGGFAATMSDSLPKIGENMTGFLGNLAPFLESISKVDGNASAGAESVAKVILALTTASVIDGLTTWLTGGTDFVKFGKQLSEFAPYLVQYADAVDGLNGDVITASTTAAGALSELANGLPNSGGLAGWFNGENDIDSWGAKLPVFGRYLKQYADEVSGLDAGAIEASSTAASALSELANGLPNSGGIAAWFAGDNDIDAWGAKLPVFAGYIKQYADAVSGIDAGAITSSANAALALAEFAANLPNEGGMASWFAGDNSIDAFGAMLPDLGADLKAFSDNASGVNLESATAAVSLLEKIIGVAGSMNESNGLDTLIGKLGELASALNNLKMPDLRSMRMNISFQTSFSPGTSKVLDMMGLPGTPLVTWTTYASGGFPAVGEAFIARERGPELVGRIGNKTAVANNDQITTGIASAVYEAMMAAHADGSYSNGGNSSARIVVQIGERAVGEAAVDFINGQIRQTGQNPIYA